MHLKELKKDKNLKCGHSKKNRKMTVKNSMHSTPKYEHFRKVSFLFFIHVEHGRKEKEVKVKRMKEILTSCRSKLV